MKPSIDQPARPSKGDWLVVVALLVLTVAPYALSGRVLLASVLALQVIPLAWRRCRPALSFCVVAAATLAQVPAYDQPVVPNVALMIALASLITWTTGFRWYATGLAVCVIGSVVAGVDWSLDSPYRAASGVDTSQALTFAVGCLICVAAAVAFGEAGRRRRQLLLQLHARAVDAERERDQHARLAAQTERTRIAREMHDVVAHALAVIVVQSDGAAYAVRHSGSPDAAAQALDTIGTTSRSALSETRRLVGALREDGETLELGPSSTAAAIPDLVAGVRDAGLAVDLTHDDLTAVPPAVGAAVFRIVQEALTNVIKHGGPDATATVEVRVRGSEVAVTVADTGRGVLPGSDQRRGYGLIGMQERLSVLGGALTTHGRPGGGFVVSGEIPCVPTDHTSPSAKAEDR